ncbi:hypothetical protein MKZ38_007132 [Zalerion maritima]|uniref:AB hydrolase-1 domain-containing protein n=1 Tax=Zalerion maritima TaxID=339359 RepID=A0AAD5WTQ9_9PEZI|nr:hypothetical protein MKZ38_007132 [Zalerion maritima]
MSSPKPTIVFAPGAWHTPDCFDIVREQLHSQGWETEAVTYPSVGAEPPTQGLQGDADAVREVVAKLADEGKKVVLAVHSYGGLVGAEASKGLGFQQRKREGKDGGITMLVYLAAFVTPVGKSIKMMLGGQFLPWMNFKGEYVHADEPHKVFYADVDPELQEKSIKALKHQSAPVFTDCVTYEPWHEIECMYLMCEKDQALFAQVQEMMIQMLGEKAPVYKCNSSHSPFLSMPEEVVKGLEMAAKVGEERAS